MRDTSGGLGLLRTMGFGLWTHTVDPIHVQGNK